ncbi:MAG: hypothetical protein IDH49_03575 [Gammaproteobacteria bacterium]|nr:hypothetical protein [Gammaproteobacteria bacterium]
MPRTNFVPARHGFHFRNDFVNNVATIPFFGNVTTRGRCGGMAYAALDYYHAGIPTPTHNTSDFPGTGVPADGTRLADYIYWRLLNSFTVPTTMNFITWTMHADHATWFFKGVTRWTKEDEFSKLRRYIDSGTPVVLGLVCSRDLTQIGDNHQVVAYGYDFDPDSETITIYIYDNNYPDQEVVLSSDRSNPHFNESTGAIWRGFFVQDYGAQRPTYLDLAISRGIWVSSSHPTLGGHFDCQYTVRNYGDYPAHLQFLYLYLRGPSGENLDSFLGSDANATPLQANEERMIFKASERFSTLAGNHTIGAAYFSERGEWIGIPAGEPGAAREVVISVEKPKEKEKEKEKEQKDKEKDRKDTKEKEVAKNESKEAKELTKEKDRENYYTPKEFAEDFSGGTAGHPSFEERLTRVEAAVGQLSHFISPELRPDLSIGSLRREPDLDSPDSASLRQRLQKQAADAKQAKDGKDIEKPREG